LTLPHSLNEILLVTLEEKFSGFRCLRSVPPAPAKGENLRLKRLFKDLTLDKSIFQEVIAKI
jgi:hypothetical protein